MRSLLCFSMRIEGYFRLFCIKYRMKMTEFCNEIFKTCRIPRLSGDEKAKKVAENVIFLLRIERF